MNFQFWDTAAASAMFNTTNQNSGTFPGNVSAYFRRPAKVVKSTSRNNSPRSTGRRRMTTTGHYPARTRSVVDYQRSSMPHLSQYQSLTTRPISWHPNTMEDMSYLQIPSQHMVDGMMASPYTVAETNGLVTPMSFPVIDEPQIQELISPLEELSAEDPHGASFTKGQDFSMEAWLSQQQMKSRYHSNDSMYPDMDYSSWHQLEEYGLSGLASPAATTSYLPMLDTGVSLSSAMQQTVESDREELVGMGLYDSPADVQSSTLLFGTATGLTPRKTLKLEDAFEPQPGSDDDDVGDPTSDDDNDEDAPADPDDEVYAAPAAINNLHHGASMTNMPTSYMGQYANDFQTIQQWTLQQPSQGQHTWI